MDVVPLRDDLGRTLVSALEEHAELYLNTQLILGKCSHPLYELHRPGVWKEIPPGSNAMFHQTPSWKWAGDMDTPSLEQPSGLISTS
jgi:hypothetical protein